MSATGLDAALAWLDVALSCLERAEECAELARVEIDARYQAARAALKTAIVERAHDFSVGRAILEGIDRDRVKAGVFDRDVHARSERTHGASGQGAAPAYASGAGAAPWR